jgi:hypothetical protein
MPPTNWPRSATPHEPPILRSLQSHPPPSSWLGDRCMGQFHWRGQDRRVVWGIVLLLLLRFVSAAAINLSPQEAYYWNYSALHLLRPASAGRIRSYYSPISLGSIFPSSPARRFSNQATSEASALESTDLERERTSVRGLL